MDEHVHPNRLSEIAHHPDPNAPEWTHIAKCQDCQKLLEAFSQDIQAAKAKNRLRRSPRSPGNGSAKS